MAAKSKKFQKVIEGVRTWSMNTFQSALPSSSIDLDECLRSEHFQIGRVAVHGFPYCPTCLAVDPVQKLVAVGTKSGAIRIFGRPGVDYLINHPSSSAVIQLVFLINEGGLISICQDDVVHLWNIRQRNPEIVHSLHFKREHLACGHLPVKSHWLYLGTDKGNVHVVNIQQFTTSGYIINWNKAIELSQNTHPGRVVQIEEHPQDANKLLIGYFSGLVVLWDLLTKSCEARFRYTDNLNGFCWHWEGKTFMTCHNFGLLVTWSCRQPQQPISVICPQAEGDSVPEDYRSYAPIQRVEWLPGKSGEPFIIFTGGNRIPESRMDANVTADQPSPANPASSVPSVLATAEADSDLRPSSLPTLTVKRGKRVVVMQLDHMPVDFVSLSASPYLSELMDPYATVVLLQDDLVVIDLLSPNYATFENPYPMDLHIPPVTSCLYLVDCPGDLIPAFYAAGSRANLRRDGDGDAFSSREWPITGGEWGQSYHPYPEILLTGHADGSVRFWDASEMTLTPLYKIRTFKFFCSNLTESHLNPAISPSADDVNLNFSPNLLTTEVDPYAVLLLHFCPDSRRLLTASTTHVCLLHFSKREQQYEIPVIDINMTYDCLEEMSMYGAADAFVDEQSGGGATRTITKETIRSTSFPRTGDSVSSGHSAFATDRDVRVFVAVRPGVVNWPPGYQPSLICRAGIPSLGSDPSQVSDPTLLPPPSICVIQLNSSYGLLAMGNEYGFALVNYLTCVCILTASTTDVCGGISDLPNRLPNRSVGRAMTGSPSEARNPDKTFSSASTTPLPVTGVPITLRSQTFSVDPQAQSPDSFMFSSSTSRCGMAPKAAPFRGELKRAKSQEKWSEVTASQMQSLSGSTSSLEQPTSEGVRTFAFSDFPIRKQDGSHGSSLWIGTTRGNTLAMSLNTRELHTQHMINPVIPTGFIYRLQGEVVLISFLDPAGIPLCGPSCNWEDVTFVNPKLTAPKPTESSATFKTVCDVPKAPAGNQQVDHSTVARRLVVSSESKSLLASGSRTPLASNSSSELVTSGQAELDKRLVVLCSEKQACVVGLPSQTCISKVKITETSRVVRASVQRLRLPAAGDASAMTTFLACYLANGHFLAFSLPSLRMLMDVDYLPFSECVSKSFSFGQHGQAIYLISPSELLKITLSADLCSNLRDMQGELFVPCTMPDPPRKSFIMNLLTGNLQTTFDRNELFGESTSGRSAPGTSTLLPNVRMDKVTGQASMATSEIARARNAAIERGERLQQLDLHAQEMADQAKGFGQTAARLAAKYEKKDKRWGWPL